MPCASCFAVCCLSGTRQRHYLPCAKETTHGKYRAHGKDHICRVPYVGHTAKLWQRACGLFCLPCATRLAHGKHVSSFHWPCGAKGHTAKSFKKNLILPSQIFLFCAYNTCCFVLNFGTFLYSFTIFSEFICLIKFLAIELEVF